MIRLAVKSAKRPARPSVDRRTPSIDAYLTDGRMLFRVARTLASTRADESLVELEDCATLELLLCSARQISRAGLRAVTPVLGS